MSFLYDLVRQSILCKHDNDITVTEFPFISTSIIGTKTKYAKITCNECNITYIAEQNIWYSRTTKQSEWKQFDKQKCKHEFFEIEKKEENDPYLVTGGSCTNLPIFSGFRLFSLSYPQIFWQHANAKCLLCERKIHVKIVHDPGKGDMKKGYTWIPESK